MRKVYLWISVLMVMAVLLASCGPQATTAAPQPTQAQEAAPTLAPAPTQAPEATQDTSATATGKRKVVYFVGFGTGTAPAQVDGQKIADRQVQLDPQ